MTMQLPRAFSIRSRQSTCMITVTSHGQRHGRVFSNISKCSIIGRGGIQPSDTGHRNHSSWRLWQPNLIKCPQNRGKTNYHLLIETPKTNISQIMQNVNTSYTVYINKKNGRSGHLFQGRFKGIIVDKNEYLLTLSRYIHLNPVRAGIVAKPEESRWTSYKTYVAETEGRGLVDKTDTLAILSEKKKKAIEKYRAFVEAGIEGVASPFKEAEAGLILGK